MSDIVLATAEFCGPCKMLKKRIADAGLEVEIKTLEEDSEFFTKYGIRGVPALVLEDGSLLSGLNEIYNKIVEVKG